MPCGRARAVGETAEGWRGAGVRARGISGTDGEGGWFNGSRAPSPSPLSLSLSPSLPPYTGTRLRGEADTGMQSLGVGAYPGCKAPCWAHLDPDRSFSAGGIASSSTEICCTWPVSVLKQ